MITNCPIWRYIKSTTKHHHIIFMTSSKNLLKYKEKYYKTFQTQEYRIVYNENDFYCVDVYRDGKPVLNFFIADEDPKICCDSEPNKFIFLDNSLPSAFDMRKAQEKNYNNLCYFRYKIIGNLESKLHTIDTEIILTLTEDEFQYKELIKEELTKLRYKVTDKDKLELLISWKK